MNSFFLQTYETIGQLEAIPEDRVDFYNSPHFISKKLPTKYLKIDKGMNGVEILYEETSPL